MYSQALKNVSLQTDLSTRWSNQGLESYECDGNNIYDIYSMIIEIEA